MEHHSILRQQYARNVETHVSVMHFHSFLLGVPISWQSKSQRSVTLSLSKTEFIALSKAAKEIKFVGQVMQSIERLVKIPIKVSWTTLEQSSFWRISQQVREQST